MDYIARQVPLSMGFSRQEYWSGLSFPSPGDLPDPDIKLKSLVSPALEGRFFTNCTTWEAYITIKQWPKPGDTIVLTMYRSYVVRFKSYQFLIVLFYIPGSYLRPRFLLLALYYGKCFLELYLLLLSNSKVNHFKES